MFFYFMKTLNSHCDNNGVQKLKNPSAAHKIITDFVLRFT